MQLVLVFAQYQQKKKKKKIMFTRIEDNFDASDANRIFVVAMNNLSFP